MSRSKWKGPYLNPDSLKTISSNNFKKQKNNIVSRNSEIIPKFLGLTFYVHNGKNYSELTVSEDMVGHKFGEFVFTRAKFSFKKKKTKK
jgi:ribosomal protein S19